MLLGIKNLINTAKSLENGKYLVLFQNNSEMRPTGGFIGSFAVIELENFKVRKIDFNTNIYKLDNTYKAEHVIIPPKPLASISNNQWSLCDANFAVSFPEAAEKVKWFYTEETGGKVDGVIAVNASLVRDILQKVGSIKLDKYDAEISAENFFTELTQKIEQDYYKDGENIIENEPKSILKDMMPELFSRVLELGKIEIIKILVNALNTKEILVYSNNGKIEKAILARNWGGKVNETKGDYLQINNANIADTKNVKDVGGKSSLNVDEAVDYSVVNKAGNLKSDLTINRFHNGSYDWPDGVNHSWTKILVPLGSNLTSAKIDGKDVIQDVETGEEAGKTYFATWVDAKPQEKTELHITYVLPIEAKNYNLLVQKQPGNQGDQLKVSFVGEVLFNGLLNKDILIR